MSNLLTFITTFGTAAEMRALSSQELTAKMREFGLTEEEMEVVLEGDQERFVNLINNGEDITCLIVAPEEPDDGDDESQEESEENGEQNLAIAKAV